MDKSKPKLNTSIKEILAKENKENKENKEISYRAPVEIPNEVIEVPDNSSSEAELNKLINTNSKNTKSKIEDVVALDNDVIEQEEDEDENRNWIEEEQEEKRIKKEKKNKQTNYYKITDVLKSPVLLFILFVLFTSPQYLNTLHTFFPRLADTLNKEGINELNIMGILIKAIVFVFVYVIIRKYMI